MRYALTAVLAAALGTALAAQSSMPASTDAPQKYTAFLVDINNPGPRPTATSIDFTITRWSTPQERDRLRNILKERGEKALLEALQKLPVVGYINTPGSLRYDLHYAWETPGPESGGHTITLATDRYVTAWEALNQPRVSDYPFTVFQLQLNNQGKGVGKASIATKITQKNDGTIELENFEAQPVMLNDVHPSK